MRPAKKRTVTPEQALIRLETLCAASEQCSDDLRQKLRRWEVDDEEAERILARLVERKFVDDERFARAYVRDKYRFSRWGRTKIVMGLRAKRISREAIAEAMTEIDLDEYTQILEALLRAKVRSARLSRDYADRSKLFRFGASRGFESGLISQLINSGSPWAQDDDGSDD